MQFRANDLWYANCYGVIFIRQKGNIVTVVIVVVAKLHVWMKSTRAKHAIVGQPVASIRLIQCKGVGDKSAASIDRIINQVVAIS